MEGTKRLLYFLGQDSGLRLCEKLSARLQMVKVPSVPTGALRRYSHLPGSCMKCEDSLQYGFCGISEVLRGKKSCVLALEIT